MDDNFQNNFVTIELFLQNIWKIHGLQWHISLHIILPGISGELVEAAPLQRSVVLSSSHVYHCNTLECIQRYT